ncbi:MAG: hypothetical protein GY898_12545 [Proteobacteria bacterium]|nr:hypothetical protein [Pseudomonadota bacterium]
MPTERFVVLGFDGVDPDLIRDLWAQGELPNLKALADEGSFADLGSTTPPQSPVAWTSFATGKLPGKHGVFDFIGRKPKLYLPKMGFVEYVEPRFNVQGEAEGTLQGTNLRRGEPFWMTASEAGLDVRIVNVPYSWPPEPVPHGGVASGLGLPDLRPTNSTSTVFSTDFDAPAALGGVRGVPLNFVQGQAAGSIEGPRANASGKRGEIPVGFKLDPANPGVLEISTWTIAIQVPVGQWSDWVVLDLPAGKTATAKGQVRFRVIEANADRVHVYMTPVGADPEHPWVPLSHPPELARELMAAAGRYKTVGWEEDTQALNTELVSEDVFLEEVHTVMDQRTAMTLAAMDQELPPLFVSVWTGTDRVAHMLWRLTDPTHPRYDASLAGAHAEAITDMYKRMDDIVGQVRSKLPEGTTLVVMSDHGFHSFSRQFHVNNWLIDHGYLVLKPGGGSLQEADWSKTRAYSLGTGQIYVNLQGREGQGAVPFGQIDALVDEIQASLAPLTDPANGAAVFIDVHKGRVLYAGGAPGAPDLQLAFAPGYQTSWTTKLGGVGATQFEDNPKKWSGDHAASSAAETKGILFVSKPTNLQEPGIEDLAPTFLRGLGVALPPDLDGAPLW